MPWSREHDVADGRFSKLSTEKIVDYPDGYPKFAAFINSSDEFRVYRRFGTLRVYLLLRRQAELNALEKKLQKLDKEDARDASTEQRIRSVRRDKQDPDSTREDLMNEIDQKLQKYDQLLQSEARSLAMSKPTKRNHRSVFNYAWNKKFFPYSETEFLNQADDFITTAPIQDSSLHVAVETLIQKFGNPWLQHVFSTEAQRASRGNEVINLYSSQRIRYVVETLVFIFLLVAMLAPICLLFEVNSNNNKVKIIMISCFLLLFPPLMRVLTRAKNHELIAITGGYCAVLVVFLGNLSM